jgi:transcriptional regulator with XRE-family HTH domain
MSFSERLKEERIKQGWSQTDLAQKVDLSYTQIGRYENHGSQPSAEVVTKLAKVLEVSPDYLLTGSKVDKPQEVNDKEFFKIFQEAERLPPDKKKELKSFLKGYLLIQNIKENYL